VPRRLPAGPTRLVRQRERPRSRSSAGGRRRSACRQRDHGPPAVRCASAGPHPARPGRPVAVQGCPRACGRRGGPWGLACVRAGL